MKQINETDQIDQMNETGRLVLYDQGDSLLRRIGK
jgi:hypothetical protein